VTRTPSAHRDRRGEYAVIASTAAHLLRRIALCWGPALLLALSPAWVNTALADLTIRGLLVTHSGPVVDTLEWTMQLKGSSLRRGLEGKGTLADFLGRRLEILNRTTGESALLDLDAGTCTRSSGGPTGCHPWYLFDLRWLGRRPSGAAAELALPDTTITVLGVRARAFEFRIPARQEGGSTVRFWVVNDLDSLFGAAGAQSLYCGPPGAGSDRGVATDLSKRFALTPEAAERLGQVPLGYPVRIETFLGEGPERLELSRFETISVEHTALPDSLFEVPSSCQPAGSQGGR
jgi:hypothetical protein